MKQKQVLFLGKILTTKMVGIHNANTLHSFIIVYNVYCVKFIHICFTNKNLPEVFVSLPQSKYLLIEELVGIFLYSDDVFL